MPEETPDEVEGGDEFAGAGFLAFPVVLMNSSKMADFSFLPAFL
jgi:hypothetical protein